MLDMAVHYGMLQNVLKFSNSLL